MSRRPYLPLVTMCADDLSTLDHFFQTLELETKQANPKAVVLRLKAKEYFDQAITAVRLNKLNDFRAKYTVDVDLLLIEEVEGIAAGDFVQDELLNTIRTIERLGRRVVVSAKTHPVKIAMLKWGLLKLLTSRVIEIGIER